MILLALLLAATPTPAAERMPLLDADFAALARADAALAPHIEDDIALDGKPGTDRLVAAQWQAMQQWVADWIDLHPGATPAALVEAGKGFGDKWSMRATALGHDAVLVSVSRYQLGNVFILAADTTGRHRLAWSSATPQHRLNAAADRALASWQPAELNYRQAGRPLGSADVGRLPDAADGATRFWISGGYAQMAGATIGQQLSLWSWRHGRVRPLLVHDFAVMADQDGPVMRAAILHVPSKRSWRSLFACGGCFGRVTDLRFVIGPTGVHALPPRSETPELDLIDRVYARVLARQPAGTLAPAAALRVIRMALRDRLAEKYPQLRGFTGMVMGWSRWRSHGRRWACLVTDEIAPLAFAFDPGLHRITEARMLGPKACQGKGSRM